MVVIELETRINAPSTGLRSHAALMPTDIRHGERAAGTTTGLIGLGETVTWSAVPSVSDSD